MNLKQPYALIGNGPEPTHPIVKEKLKKMKTFLCVDGGADKALRMGYKPNVIIGDMDSIIKSKAQYDCKIVLIEDQSKNDLEKSLAWCLKNNIKALNLFGFSHGRDDHNLANLFIMQSYSERIKMIMYSNKSKIFYIRKHTNFSSIPNQIVSIFPNNKDTKISTTGLKYKLNDSSLKFPSHGLSNLSIGSKFSIHPSDWVCVIVNYM